MKITREIVLAAQSKKGGWTKVSAQLLGVPYPLQAGWIDRIIGQEISTENYRQIVPEPGPFSIDDDPADEF